MTRAKAASGDGLKSNTALGVSKTSYVNILPEATRKRAALGDLSRNVNKDQPLGLKGKASSKLVSTKPKSTLTSNTISTTVADAAAAKSRTLKVSSLSANNRTETRVETKSNVSQELIPANRRANSSISIYSKSNIPDSKQRLNSSDKSEKIHKLDVDENERSSTETEGQSRAAKKQKVVEQDWDDLDKDDLDDPLMVSEYVVEIFEFLYELQDKYMPDPNYMDKQKGLDWNTRGVLIDYLVEVHMKFRLSQESLLLAVNIFDRFMSKVSVPLDKIQLYGIVSMFIAAKYEEIFSPSVQHYVVVVDETYNEDEILEAERKMLKVLNFEISYPNPMNFLRRISKAENYDIQTRTIGKYLLEISLLDHRLLKYKPSEISAAAIYLARIMLKRPGWNGNLIHYSGGYDESQIYPIVAIIVDYLAGRVVHETFFKKYASKRYLKASIIARAWARDHCESFPLVK